MPDRDSLIVVASHLRPEEAGMLRGLLESAGIDAVLRDDMVSAVNPFLQLAIGGVKLAVRASDAEHAHEIIRSAGVLPGLGPDEPVDIPEDEWAGTGTAEGPAVEERAPSRTRWMRRAVLAALVLLAWLLAFYW